jgi:hypothetical protein
MSIMHCDQAIYTKVGCIYMQLDHMLMQKYTFWLQQQEHVCKFCLQGSLASYQSYPKINIQFFLFDIEIVISFFTM